MNLKNIWYGLRTRSREMKAFIESAPPSRSSLIRDVPFLVVDLETTSLSPNDGEIASIGWVKIVNGAVNLSSCENYLLKLEQGVGQSAIYHSLSDDQLADGNRVSDVFEHFLDIAKGHILVFHHAPLDMGFLNILSKKLTGVPLPATYVDTLEIERQKLTLEQAQSDDEALRLHRCRARYGLPDYPPHEALADAMATAELLLAHCAYRGEELQLGDLL